MSIDIVNAKGLTKKDITWDSLVSDSESQIKVYRQKIEELRKSIKFFKKKASLGVPFPMGSKEKVKKTY
jgi:hypothetical protein